MRNYVSELMSAKKQFLFSLTQLLIKVRTILCTCAIVLLDIEKGLYDKDFKLESFPKGLQGYYDFHWRRMGMTANPLPDTKNQDCLHSRRGKAACLPPANL